MSGWTLTAETDDSLAPAQRNSNNRTAATTREQPSSRNKTRRAFFGDDSDDEADKVATSAPGASSAADTHKRDSLTLASAAAVVSRRAQRNNRTELVVDDSDADDVVPLVAIKNDPVAGTARRSDDKRANAESVAAASAPAPARLAIAVRDGTASKSEEIAMADLVRPTLAVESTLRSNSSNHDQYIHCLVRDFVQLTYPRSVLEIFDKELPPSGAAGAVASDELHQMHRRLVGSQERSTSGGSTTTGLEQTLLAWDGHAHRRHLVRSSSSSSAGATSSSSSSSSSSKSKSKSSSTASSSRKKPQLSVTISSDETTRSSNSTSTSSSSDDVDYNRLNHPGHTPKAQQTALLAAMMGEPGSTPKANAGELRALGFDDVDDDAAESSEQPLAPVSCCRRPRSLLIPSPKANVLNDPYADDDDDDDHDHEELSLYAQRKRAARHHDKHVYFGDAGRTPTKEYVFFRETPPRFVTETVEDAEQVLRSLGGNPDARRQSLLAVATKLERFVELQSSDVAKYAIGQRVDNLGAQRNVTGLVSKLYGSRLCGMAGPGTIIIDTWMGDDTAPCAGSTSSGSMEEEPRLSQEDEQLIDQLIA